MYWASAIDLTPFVALRWAFSKRPHYACYFCCLYFSVLVEIGRSVRTTVEDSSCRLTNCRSINYYNYPGFAIKDLFAQNSAIQMADLNSIDHAS